jgi:hypothetical protein
MNQCVCGPQNWHLEATGGVVYGGIAYLSEPPLRGDGGIVVGGSCEWDIGNDLGFGYHHLLHLQESGGPYDNDGTGNDGTSSKPPIRQGRGLFGGYAQEFKGFEFIDINSDSIDSSKPWTFSAWVSFNSFYRQAYLFRFGENRIWWNVLNQFQFSTLFDGDEENTWATSTTIHQDDCWHHVCVVHRPAESIEVWVDGDLERTRTITRQLPASSFSSIGRDRMEQAKAEARIQEVRLKYGALSPEQIAYEYQVGCGRGFVSVGGWESA